MATAVVRKTIDLSQEAADLIKTIRERNPDVYTSDRIVIETAIPLLYDAILKGESENAGIRAK